MSDKRLGNYRTQVICQVIWVIGQAIVLLLTVSAVDKLLGGVTGHAVVPLVTIGLLVLAVGYGLIQPMQSVLVADQFDENGDEESNKQRASSFSWFDCDRWAEREFIFYVGFT
jgi:dipeptide/tripeptide permease